MEAGSLAAARQQNESAVGHRLDRPDLIERNIRRRRRQPVPDAGQQGPEAVPGAGGGDPFGAGPGEGIGRLSEIPVGPGEFRRHGKQRGSARRRRRPVPSDQVPPPAPVRDVMQRSGRRPGRLHDRDVVPAIDHHALSKHAGIQNAGHHQPRPVPRHVGVVPLDPGEPVPVGVKAGAPVEVGSRRDHDGGLRCRRPRLDRHKDVERFRVALPPVKFADGDQPATARVEDEIGEAPAAAHRAASSPSGVTGTGSVPSSSRQIRWSVKLTNQTVPPAAT